MSFYQGLQNIQSSRQVGTTLLDQASPVAGVHAKNEPAPASGLQLPGILEGEDPSVFSFRQSKAIKDSVKQILKWNRSGFPGGQPVSLSMQNLTELFRNAYVACEKTDGVRFLLFSTNRRLYLIGRRDEVREVQMYLPRAVDLNDSQEMTLLDGELVQDRGDDGFMVWRYLIYDCMALDGDEEIQKHNLLRRLQAAKKFVTEPLKRLQEVQRRQAADLSVRNKEMPFPVSSDGAYVPASAPDVADKPPIEIYLKDFFEIFDLDAIRKLALRLPHLSDGIIFTPVKLPYVTGTSPLLLKWKPPHLNTVDFSVEPVYDLEGVPQIFILCASYRIVLIEMSHVYAFVGFLSDLSCRGGNAGGVIVECFWRPSAPVYTFYPALKERPTFREEQRWNTKNQGHPFYDFDRGEWREGGWVAERIRTDKPMPNDVRVLVNVKRSIDDGVSFVTLQNEIERFMHHKKRRVANFCKGVAATSKEEHEGI